VAVAKRGGAHAPGLHPEQWWALFPELSERFDAAYVVDGLSDLITPRITGPLLRREVDLATAIVIRHLNRPGNEAIAEQADTAVKRLVGTLDRFVDRSTSATVAVEAEAMCLALTGRYAAAAAAAEPLVGTSKLKLLFVTAMRLEQFEIPLAIQLLDAGRSPQEAVRSGSLIGRYRWWPSWLMRVVTEKALAGTLDEGTIAALDKCAYASLSPLQAHLARKLLGGDPGLIMDAARRLEGLGELDVAERLRQGDLSTVALAARLMSV
jgi:hypothetical protein